MSPIETIAFQTKAYGLVFLCKFERKQSLKEFETFCEVMNYDTKKILQMYSPVDGYWVAHKEGESYQGFTVRNEALLPE